MAEPQNTPQGPVSGTPASGDKKPAATAAPAPKVPQARKDNKPQTEEINYNSYLMDRYDNPRFQNANGGFDFNKFNGDIYQIQAHKPGSQVSYTDEDTVVKSMKEFAKKNGEPFNEANAREMARQMTYGYTRFRRNEFDGERTSWAGTPDTVGARQKGMITNLPSSIDRTDEFLSQRAPSLRRRTGNYQDDGVMPEEEMKRTMDQLETGSANYERIKSESELARQRYLSDQTVAHINPATQQPYTDDEGKILLSRKQALNENRGYVTTFDTNGQPVLAEVAEGHEREIEGLLNISDLLPKEKPSSAESTILDMLSPGNVEGRLVDGFKKAIGYNPATVKLKSSGGGIGQAIAEIPDLIDDQFYRVGSLQGAAGDNDFARWMDKSVLGLSEQERRQQQKETDETARQRYLDAVNVRPALNLDARGSLFSSLPSFAHVMSQGLAQQAAQQGLNLVSFGTLGTAFMSATMLETGYDMSIKAGLNRNEALGMGVGVGLLAYVTERALDPNTYGAISRSMLGRSVQRDIIQAEAKALISGVKESLAKKGILEASTAQIEAEVRQQLPGASSRLLAQFGTLGKSLQEYNKKLSTTALGITAKEFGSEFAQEGLENIGTEGINKIGREFVFNGKIYGADKAVADQGGSDYQNRNGLVTVQEDAAGVHRPAWAVAGMERGTNVFSEKSWSDILSEAWEAGIAGGLTAATVAAPGARVHAKTLREQQKLDEQDNQHRLIAKYMSEHQFAPKAAQDLKKALEKEYKQGKFAPKGLRADGTPAKTPQEEENYRVYQSLNNKIDSLQKLADTSNLRAYLSPDRVGDSEQLKDLKNYLQGNEVLGRGLENLYLVRDQQQRIERLLNGQPESGVTPEGQSVDNVVDPTTTPAPALPSGRTDAPLTTTPEQYQQLIAERRAELESAGVVQPQESAEAIKRLEERANRSKNDPALMAIEASVPVRNWFETADLVQQLEWKLSTTDGSNYQERDALQQQLAAAKVQEKDARVEMDRAATLQDSDSEGVGQVQRLAESQLELQRLRTQAEDVFNDNLLRSYLQESFATKRISDLEQYVASKQFEQEPNVVKKDIVRRELDFLKTAFTLGTPTAFTSVSQDYNLARKQFIARTEAESVQRNAENELAADTNETDALTLSGSIYQLLSAIEASSAAPAATPAAATASQASAPAAAYKVGDEVTLPSGKKVKITEIFTSRGGQPSIRFKTNDKALTDEEFRQQARDRIKANGKRDLTDEEIERDAKDLIDIEEQELRDSIANSAGQEGTISIADIQFSSEPAPDAGGPAAGADSVATVPGALTLFDQIKQMQIEAAQLLARPARWFGRTAPAVPAAGAAAAATPGSTSTAAANQSGDESEATDANAGAEIPTGIQLAGSLRYLASTLERALAPTPPTPEQTQTRKREILQELMTVAGDSNTVDEVLNSPDYDDLYADDVAARLAAEQTSLGTPEQREQVQELRRLASEAEQRTPYQSMPALGQAELEQAAVDSYSGDPKKDRLSQYKTVSERITRIGDVLSIADDSERAEAVELHLGDGIVSEIDRMADHLIQAVYQARANHDLLNQLIPEGVLSRPGVNKADLRELPTDIYQELLEDLQEKLGELYRYRDVLKGARSSRYALDDAHRRRYVKHRAATLGGLVSQAIGQADPAKQALLDEAAKLFTELENVPVTAWEGDDHAGPMVLLARAEALLRQALLAADGMLDQDLLARASSAVLDQVEQQKLYEAQARGADTRMLSYAFATSWAYNPDPQAEPFELAPGSGALIALREVAGLSRVEFESSMGDVMREVIKANGNAPLPSLEQNHALYSLAAFFQDPLLLSMGLPATDSLSQREQHYVENGHASSVATSPMTEFVLYLTGFGGSGKTKMVAGLGLRAVARLRSAVSGTSQKVIVSAPAQGQIDNLLQGLSASSNGDNSLDVQALTISDLTARLLAGDDLGTDMILVDEGSILSRDEAMNLVHALSVYNHTTRQGQAPVRMAVLGDEAQLAGRNQSGNRSQIHPFLNQLDLNKRTLPPLVEVYRNGIVPIQQVVKVYRDRITSGSLSQANNTSAPTEVASFTIAADGRLTTLEGVQFLTADAQREQFVRHAEAVRAIEEANALSSDPSTHRPVPKLRLIVSDGMANKEQGALQALGMGNIPVLDAASDNDAAVGIITVSLAQGREYEFAYVAVREQESDQKTQGQTEDSRSTLRALNVGVGRAKQAAVVRVDAPVANTQLTSIARFPVENDAARATRNGVKLTVSDAVAALAQNAQPPVAPPVVPPVTPPAGSPTPPAPGTTPGTAPGTAPGTTPGNSPVQTPDVAQQVQQLQQETRELLQEAGHSFAYGMNPQTGDPEPDEEEPDVEQGATPAQQLEQDMQLLSDRVLATMQKLADQVIKLSDTLNDMRQRGVDDQYIQAVQQLLTDVLERKKKLAESFDHHKQQAGTVDPDFSRSTTPVATDSPTQAGGVQVVVKDGVMVGVRYWLPVAAPDGSYTLTEHVKYLEDENGNPLPDPDPSAPESEAVSLARLRSLRRTIASVISHVSTHRHQATEAAVKRLAADGLAIGHTHVLENILDAKQRAARLTSKNGLVNRLLRFVLGKSGAQSITFTREDMKGVEMPSGKFSLFSGSGEFRVVYHSRFNHDQQRSGTDPGGSSEFSRDIYTVRYVEGSEWLDVAVLHKEPGAAAGRLTSGGAQLSPLEVFLNEAKTQHDRNQGAMQRLDDATRETTRGVRLGDGKTLPLKNVRQPRGRFGEDLSAPISLAEKTQRMKAEGYQVSRPYVITVGAKDNIVTLSGYAWNNRENSAAGQQGRAQLSGRAVVFVSRDKDLQRKLDAALADYQAKGYSADQAFAELMRNHELEMDVLTSRPLTLQDYLTGVTNEQGITLDSVDKLDAVLATRFDASDAQNDSLPLRDAKGAQEAWDKQPWRRLVQRGLFNLHIARHLGGRKAAPVDLLSGSSISPEANAQQVRAQLEKQPGLINKLFNTLLDAGLIEQDGVTSPTGVVTYRLADKAAQALPDEQHRQHLLAIVNQMERWDRSPEFFRRSTEKTAKGHRRVSWNTRYNQDLVAYMGFLDNALSGAVSQAWTASDDRNPIQMNPGFVGKKTNLFTPMAQDSSDTALPLDSIWQSRRVTMSDPSLQVDFSQWLPTPQAAQAPSQAATQPATQPAGQVPTQPAAGAVDTTTDMDMDLNRNSSGVRYGSRTVEQAEQDVQFYFGRNVPFRLNLVEDWRSVLGAVVKNVFTLNQLADGLVDAQTVPHEAIHYVLRIVSPAYRARVLLDARQRLMPQQGVTDIDEMSDKQVEEWLAKYYEQVYKRYRGEGREFQQRTRFIPQSILRLYRALRQAYNKLRGQPDRAETLFEDLEKGYFRNRKTRAEYGVYQEGDMFVQEDVEYNRNEAGQREEDYQALLGVFGSAQRLEEARRAVAQAINQMRFSHGLGRPYRDSVGAVGVVRQTYFAHAKKFIEQGLAPDSASTNAQVRTATRVLRLAQPIKLAPSVVNGVTTARAMKTPLDIIIEREYPWLAAREVAENDPYREQLSTETNDPDSGLDQDQVTSINEMANAIGTRAYYLEDKNREARSGRELELIMENVPLFERDLTTGKYYRSPEGYAVDPSDVKRILKNMGRRAREIAAHRGRTQPTLEDLREALSERILSSDGRTMTSTGRQHANLASVYRRLFDAPIGSAGGLTQQLLAGMSDTDNRETSLYATAFPAQLGVPTARINPDQNPDDIRWGTDAQRLLSQLLSYATGIERRDFLSVDMTTGQKEDKGRNAELMRKNFNQSSLLTSLFKKTNNRWVPRRERLEGLRTDSASFRFEYVEADRNQAGAMPRMQVVYSGNVTGQEKAEGVPVFVFSAAPGAMPYEAAALLGEEVADVDQDVLLEAAHALIRNLGLPLSKAQLREMVLSEVDPKRVDHNSFRSKLPQFLANMYVPLLAAHYHNDVNRDLLSGMGVEDGSLITQEPVLREGVGSLVDDLDQVGAGDERSGDKKAENPRQFSPTGRWSDVQWLARQQERNVESGTPDFTYNYEGNKMHRDQLGNGVYQQLRSLGLQARQQDDQARFEQLLQDVVKEAKQKDADFDPANYPEYMAGMAENIIASIGYDPRGNYINQGLFNPAAGYTNRVANQAWQVEVFQANDLTDKRTGKKKAFVAGTPAELHEAGIVHVFLRSVAQGKSEMVRLLGTTISDKSTQRIFALSSKGGGDRVIVDLGSDQERERILHVKNSYSALLRGSILPRYQAAGLAIASDPATLSDEQLLDLLDNFLRTNPESIRGLAENADYARKGATLSVNPLLRQVTSMSDEEFVQMVKADNDAEAQNIYSEGLVVLPYKLVKSLASYLDQDWKDVEKDFATANSGQQGDEGDGQTEYDEQKKKVPRYLRVRREIKDEQGNVTGYEYNPALRLFTTNNFLLQHELFTALNGHHLYYKNKGDAGLVDMVKRGIINATNYEAFDVSTPRGLGQTSKLLLIDDETFDSILGSENVDRYPYLNEDGTPGVFERVSEDNQTLALINEMGFNDGKLRSQDLFDGQGYMLPLHAILEDESLGGKYLRDATPDEMQRLGLAGPAIKLFSSATRKNFLGQASSSSDGAPAMLKVADAVLTNGFLDQANGRVWRLRQLMLGGPNSPLYLRWQQIYDESTPQQRAMNYDWIRLHEEFIRPENRAVWEPYLIGRAGHPSGFKVAPRRVNGWNSAQELQGLDENGAQQWIAGNTLQIDNQSYGKVLDLSADPFLQSISRITQEDHIVSLLRDNYKTSKELYRLLSLLAEEGMFKLQDEVDEAGGKAYFMGRLADLLQNMGNVSNTLSLARDAGTSANHPLVAKALQNAIATSLKAYSVKQRMDGVRATVQSSTGLVNMYQIKGGTRLTQAQALRSGFVERDNNGDLRPTTTGQALGIRVDELAFMRLYDKQTNQLVPEQQARDFVRAVARAEVDPEAAALVKEFVDRYRIEPMEVLVSRDTVAKFNIDSWRDVNDVTEEYFIEREELAARQKISAMSLADLQALNVDEQKLARHQKWLFANNRLDASNPDSWEEITRRDLALSGKLRAARGRGQEVWENWQKALQPKNTRIPVTNMNSVQLARVVGFVDGAMNTQLVPSELLTVAGADNDGDMSTMEFYDVRPGGYSYRGILPQATDDTQTKPGVVDLDNLTDEDAKILPKEELVKMLGVLDAIEQTTQELGPLYQEARYRLDQKTLETSQFDSNGRLLLPNSMPLEQALGLIAEGKNLLGEPAQALSPASQALAQHMLKLSQTREDLLELLRNRMQYTKQSSLGVFKRFGSYTPMSGLTTTLELQNTFQGTPTQQFTTRKTVGQPAQAETEQDGDVLMHELVHNLTALALDSKSPFYNAQFSKRIKELYKTFADHYKAEHGSRDAFKQGTDGAAYYYALNTPNPYDEFLADLFTSPDFRAYLATIPPSKKTLIQKAKNLLEEIFGVVASLFPELQQMAAAEQQVAQATSEGQGNEAQKGKKQKPKSQENLLFETGLELLRLIDSTDYSRVAQLEEAQQTRVRVRLFDKRAKLQEELEVHQEKITQLEALRKELARRALGDKYQMRVSRKNNRLQIPPGLVRQQLYDNKQRLLTDAGNLDQLLKPIDITPLGPLVARAKAREIEVTAGASAVPTTYGPLAGVLRHQTNVRQLVSNQAGKSGVGPTVKSREVYNAAVRIERVLGTEGFVDSVYFMGEKIEGFAQNERSVGTLFEMMANAALDNAKENYLGWLNFSKTTWGLWGAAVMTMQNLEQVTSLITHPVAMQLVRQVERRNNIRSNGRDQKLLGKVEDILVRGKTPDFDEKGVRLGGEDNMGNGFARLYDTKNGSLRGQGTITLFNAVQNEQARRYELMQQKIEEGLSPEQARAAAYPDLNRSLLDPTMTDAERFEIRRYIVENLYLTEMRAAELADAQRLLGVMDGVDGDDAVSLQQLSNVLTALRVTVPTEQGEKLSPIELLDRRVEMLSDLVGVQFGKVSNAMPNLQRQQLLRNWAEQPTQAVSTLNARHILAENEFLQQAVRALVVDYQLRRELMISRQPMVFDALSAIEGSSDFFWGDSRNKQMLRREFDRFLDGITMGESLKLATAELQTLAEQVPGSPLLLALSKQNLDTVVGRQHFVQQASEYLLQVKAGGAQNTDATGVGMATSVSQSPLMQNITFTASPDKFQMAELVDATNLTPDAKNLLQTHFSDLGTQYGPEGKALRHVLLAYQLLTKGMNLGRGSLAEILDVESMRMYNTQRANLELKFSLNGNAQALAWLGDFSHQFFLLNPKAAPLMRFPATRNMTEEEAADGPDLDIDDEGNIVGGVVTTPDGKIVDPSRLSNRYWSVDPDELPDSLKEYQIRAAFPRHQKLEHVPRYLRVANAQSPGQVVLYSARPGATGWYRTYPVASPVINQYGEETLRNTLPAYVTTDLRDPLEWRNPDSDFARYLQQAAKRAIATNQVTADGAFDIRVWGNRRLHITREMYCSL